MSAYGDRPATLDPSITANTLAGYVPALRAEGDDVWRSRLVLHDFGLVWLQHANRLERIVLIAVEPPPFEARWDAFLAAYTEHLCGEATLEPPAWTSGPGRYLTERWMALGRAPWERASVIATTPEAFAAHGIWFPAHELLVV